MTKRPYFDLAKICEFIEHSDKHKVKETEIIDTIDNSQEQVPGERILKTVRENIVQSNQQIDNIRYDLIKTLMLIITESQINSDDENAQFNIGEQLAINTLIKNKMLKI